MRAPQNLLIVGLMACYLRTAPTFLEMGYNHYNLPEQNYSYRQGRLGLTEHSIMDSFFVLSLVFQRRLNDNPVHRLS